ncbi:MAG: hypothetical protein M1130_03700 [Actinobacteria bacterium]|nr:hypothetical protein [Actinomycetota bacterium]
MKKIAANREIDIVIRPDGTVESHWWTPELAVMLCLLCGKQGAPQCAYCLNANRWCG